MLKHNKYFVESSHPSTVQLLLKDPIIRGARITEDATNATTGNAAAKKTGTAPAVAEAPNAVKDATSDAKNAQDVFASVMGADRDDLEDDDINISFQIDDSRIDVSTMQSYGFCCSTLL